MHRRQALRGLGVCLTLPFLESLFPRAMATPSAFKPLQATSAVHPRIISCYVPNGVNILEWVPKDDGPNYTLSPTLEVLKDQRANFTVISGLSHPASQGGHSGADTWLTGADLKAIPGSDYSNSVSADQIVAEVHGKQTRFASLQLGDGSGTGAAGHSHTLSFDRSGTPLPAENSPKQLFERLFVPEGSADRAATLRRYAEKKSILDNVLGEAKRLEPRLGQNDRRKLDEYLSSVRQTEERVGRLESWVDIPKTQVDAKDLQLANQPGDAHDRPMWIDVMLELSYLSFLTDSTRVIAYEWSREAGGYGGGGENHHELSHHGGDAGMLNKLAEIDRFHVSRLGRFLSFLESTNDGDGRMLDNTIVLFGSGMNSGVGGEHSPKNLPFLIAGGKNLGLRHGQHLAFDPEKRTRLANVLLACIRALGVEAKSFSDSTGALAGLTS